MEELLTCKFVNCNKFYLDPVILPCNNTVCKQHVDDVIAFDVESDAGKQRVLKCQFCNEEHEITNEGFPINKEFQEAMNLDLHLSDKAKEVKELLKKFESTIREFQSIQEDPEAYITNYVNSVKNRVELQKDKMKLKVDLMSDDLLDKLKTFEDSLKYGHLQEQNQDD